MSVEIHTDEQLADSPVLQAVFGEALPQIEVFHGKLQAEGEERGLIGPRDVDIIWERHLLNSAAIVRRCQKSRCFTGNCRPKARSVV